ncbi:MAG: hypothetical protein Fur0018_16680 [Anaerolineales bacterium]
MPYLPPAQTLELLALLVFTLGAITFLIGILTLYRAATQPLNGAAVGQTVQAIRKAPLNGISESLAQANTLLSTISSLTETNRGIGIVLLFTGVALMFAGIGLLIWLNGSVV